MGGGPGRAVIQQGSGPGDGFRYLPVAGASPRAGRTADARPSTSCARRTTPMIAGRKNRRALRIAALVAAAGPVVALVTACSAPGGTAGARDGAPGHAATRTATRAEAGAGQAPAADV